MKIQVVRSGAVPTGQSLPKDRNVGNCLPVYTASQAVQCRTRDLWEQWVDCKRLYIVLPTVYWIESTVQSPVRRNPLTGGPVEFCHFAPDCTQANQTVCSVRMAMDLAGRRFIHGNHRRRAPENYFAHMDVAWKNIRLLWLIN